jgi:hypothetical protein
MVALLPTHIKNRNILHMSLDEHRQTDREALNEIFWLVLQPLTLQQNLSAKSATYNVLCADGNFRRCKLLSPAWIEDYSEYSDIHHLEQHVCFWCECPINEFGEYVPPDNHHPQQDHSMYQMLSDATPTQPMPNSHRTIFTEDSMGFDIFPVS